MNSPELHPSTIRILHTADWQLGQQVSRFPADDRSRFHQARIDVLTRIAAVAEEHHVQCVVVAGDVFESNSLDRKIIARAVEALKAFSCPVYLLPGNHDSLDPSTLMGSEEFLRRKPEHVHVLGVGDSVDDDGVCLVEVTDTLELLAAPLYTRHPDADLVAEALDQAPQRRAGVARVLVGHGMTDELSSMNTAVSLLSVERMDTALEAGEVDYIALGDRHSFTQLGRSGRIVYSGSPEVTDFDDTERDSGTVALVELVPSTQGFYAEVSRHVVGEWSMRTLTDELYSPEDLARWRATLEAIPNKQRTAVRYALSGTVSLTLNAQLDAVHREYADLFALLRPRTAHRLTVLPDDTDVDALELTGFAADAVTELRDQAAHGDETASAALQLIFAQLIDGQTVMAGAEQ